MDGAHGELDRRATLEVVLDAQRATLAACAERIDELDGVLAFSAPSIPDVWVTSQVRVLRPVELTELLELAERFQSDRSFRHVVLEHEPSALEVRDALDALGWRAEREVHMVLDPAAAPPPPAHHVEELTVAEANAVLRRWRLEDLPGLSERVLDELDEFHRREAEPWGERRLGVRDDAGRPVAVTMARAANGVGWVEDVYTVPEARRRGLARALVTRAVELVRERSCAPIFIVADADDFPQHLYASIGFVPIGCTHTFHLEPHLEPQLEPGREARLP